MSPYVSPWQKLVEVTEEIRVTFQKHLHTLNHNSSTNAAIHRQHEQTISLTIQETKP
jgi:hypothetical protein